MNFRNSFSQTMSCLILHVGAHNVWNGWNNSEANILFFTIADNSYIFVGRLLNSGLLTLCQTAILLEVENFEALLELFRKYHWWTFPPFLWWIITGLRRSLGLICVSGSSSPLLKKIMSFIPKTKLNYLDSDPGLFVSEMSCSVKIWEYMPLWSNFQIWCKNANRDQQDS